MKKFLLINPFGIGDVLFTTPVIKAIKDAAPDSFIGYWCNERVAPLLKNFPLIDKVFVYNRGDIKRIAAKNKFKAAGLWMGLFAGIKKERFDIAFDFSLEHRYSFLAQSAGIPKRIGFNFKGRGKFLTEAINIHGYADRHVVEYYVDLLKLSGIPVTEPKMFLSFSEDAFSRAENLLRQHGLEGSAPVIGISPGGGASWGKDAEYKHWPAENFASLADRLSEELGAKIVLVGAGDEVEIAGQVERAVKTPLVNLAGKTSLEELCAVIKNCAVLVTNDGGPLHIAVAQGVKTVSIFGPVDEKVYGPFPVSDFYRALKSTVACRPCYKNFRFSGCNNNRACLTGISVNEVFEAVTKVMT